jgi:hypothetical protein
MANEDPEPIAPRAFGSVIRLAAHVGAMKENGDDLDELREQLGTKFLSKLELYAAGKIGDEEL